MLTDYHLHLRPDEVGSAEEYFTQLFGPSSSGLALPLMVRMSNH